MGNDKAKSNKSARPKEVALDSITPNPDNPRTITADQMALLVESIKTNPEFLSKRGLVIADGVILGGNQRYEAIKAALTDEAFRERIGAQPGHIPAEWVQDASEWGEEQRRRFVILDNAPFGVSGDWDFEALKEWDDLPLLDWGIGMELSDGSMQQQLADVEIKPVEKAWVLVGIDLSEYGKIQDTVERLATLPGIIVEVRAT